MIKPLEILLRSIPLGYFMQRPPLGYYKLIFREGVLKIKDDTGVETDVGGSSGCIRRGDYVSPISYIGTAPTGSLETDSVWTITKIISNPDGTILSETVFTNVKWSDHLIL